MRKIPLKEIHTNLLNGKELVINYVDHLINVLENDTAGGMTIADVRKSLQLIDKLQAAKENDADQLFIDDNEHAMLVKKINGIKWQISAPAIVEFVDDICNAPLHNPNASSEDCDTMEERSC